MNNKQKYALKNPCWTNRDLASPKYSTRTIKKGRVYTFALVVDLTDLESPAWRSVVHVPTAEFNNQQDIAWGLERAKEQLVGVGDESADEEDVRKLEQRVGLRRKLSAGEISSIDGLSDWLQPSI